MGNDGAAKTAMIILGNDDGGDERDFGKSPQPRPTSREPIPDGSLG